MTQEAVAELDDAKVLRVGINLGNMLLVTDRKPDGTPVGVAPDMAARIAATLGTDVEYVCYPTPGEVGDAIDTWDICLIAIEPKRAEIIDFCEAYVQIEATYLVPAGSPLEKIEDVDKPGIKIAVPARAAYDLYLTRTLQHAEHKKRPDAGGQHASQGGGYENHQARQNHGPSPDPVGQRTHDQLQQCRQPKVAGDGKIHQCIAGLELRRDVCQRWQEHVQREYRQAGEKHQCI